jgi:hypothetical protein
VNIGSGVILSEAKGLQTESPLDPEILRFAQDDGR